MRAHARQTEPRAESDLKIPEFSQTAQQQERVPILAEAFGSVGNFQRVAGDCQWQFVDPLVGDEGIAHLSGCLLYTSRLDAVHFEPRDLLLRFPTMRTARGS